MKGPTICRLPCGSARRTAKPSPRSRVRGTMTRSSASQEAGSPSTGSLVGIQLMEDSVLIAGMIVADQSWKREETDDPTTQARCQVGAYLRSLDRDRAVGP